MVRSAPDKRVTAVPGRLPRTPTFIDPEDNTVTACGSRTACRLPSERLPPAVVPSMVKLPPAAPLEAKPPVVAPWVFNVTVPPVEASCPPRVTLAVADWLLAGKEALPAASDMPA